MDRPVTRHDFQIEIEKTYEFDVEKARKNNIWAKSPILLLPIILTLLGFLYLALRRYGILHRHQFIFLLFLLNTHMPTKEHHTCMFCMVHLMKYTGQNKFWYPQVFTQTFWFFCSQMNSEKPSLPQERVIYSGLQMRINKSLFMQ